MRKPRKTDTQLDGMMMLFGAISGSAVAAVSAVGTVLGPEMEEEGYDREFGAAVNITAGTTGLLIPPSNVLIVYSLASGGVSVAALFLAGYVPGILVGLLLMSVAAVMSVRAGYGRSAATPLRETVRRSSGQAMPTAPSPNADDAPRPNRWPLLNAIFQSASSLPRTVICSDLTIQERPC